MKERIAAITGATAGIGRAVAVELAARGCRMVLNGRREERLAELCAGGACVAMPGDVTEPGTADAIIARARAAWGRAPDLFVASAGRGLPGTLLTSDPAQWAALLEVNCLALMRQLRAAATSMLADRSAGLTADGAALDVVVLGSSVGTNVSPFNSVYGATKFATHGLVEGLRRELAPRRVRVTLIEPGLVRTEFQRAAGYDPAWFESYQAEVGPILEAEDVARTIAFVVEQPPHVHLNEVMIRPTRQPYP